MKTVEHSLQFITELDETNSTAKQILALPKRVQVEMLEGLLKQLLVPALKPIIDEVNEGNSYATLKVVV
jgi:hypothetical protein